MFVGWARTGHQFKVNPIGASGSLNVCRFYSVAFGARFLKRVIDERIKLPITIHWNDGLHFRVRAAQQAIQVEAMSVGMAADDRSGAYRDVA